MKKLISMLICLSMVLSMVALPVYAADETSKAPTQQSMLYYAADGSISVGGAYSEYDNLWIKFDYNGANDLMQIYGLYHDRYGTQYPTRKWYSSSSDWVGPSAFKVDSSEDTTTAWTGGNHDYTYVVTDEEGNPVLNDAGKEVEETVTTAVTESVEVKLDGDEFIIVRQDDILAVVE